MCDAQEIDRLCKTQPTGENNNNKHKSDTWKDGNRSGAAAGRGGGGGWGVGWTAAPVDATFTPVGKPVSLRLTLTP
ncbi:hypothetical protein EYF80_011268 [Liparis tanakae]|uniref:Uncharacterized protein n=1 Tax=Liparis tanakae TaxID=230148 RepID=A0A4Z2IKZ2_9TELE|nr:hypothetical protein EYF80_011268 [Liparis tanakae]